MTKALPFTKASLRRAIEAVESTGKIVVAVRPDGTLIVGDKPVDVAKLVSEDASPSVWEDVQA
jgi:hypothetical protein